MSFWGRGNAVHQNKPMLQVIKIRNKYTRAENLLDLFLFGNEGNHSKLSIWYKGIVIKRLDIGIRVKCSFKSHIGSRSLLVEILNKRKVPHTYTFRHEYIWKK